ncbi:hypothetical protein BG006_011239 [Podila minutissima]|uniref:Uncharacterized protein n=1 Tax=Podila minutissima TaxID=64525 RepID=A0A9P5SSI6_9FUNG|nr:hypothetical protein BG006_011239 [Podila minutissima]
MVQSIEPTEKEISRSVPGEEDIIIQLTTPAKGVKLSGYAVVLGQAEVPKMIASLIATRFYNKELTDTTAEYPPRFIRGLIMCSYPHGPDSSNAHQDPTLLGIPEHLPIFMVSGLEDPLEQSHGMNFGDDELAAPKKATVTAAIRQWAAQYVDGVVAGIESDQVHTSKTVFSRKTIVLTNGDVEKLYSAERIEK